MLKCFIIFAGTQGEMCHKSAKRFLLGTPRSMMESVQRCGRAELAVQNLYQSFWVQLGGCAMPGRPGLKLSQHTVPPPPGGQCPPLRPRNLFIICTRALYGRELTLRTLPSSLWVPGLCDTRQGRFIMMYWK